MSIAQSTTDVVPRHLLNRSKGTLSFGFSSAGNRSQACTTAAIRASCPPVDANGRIASMWRQEVQPNPLQRGVVGDADTQWATGNMAAQVAAAKTERISTSLSCEVSISVAAPSNLGVLLCWILSAA